MNEELGVKQFGRIVRIPSPTGFDVGDINSYVILPQGRIKTAGAN
jgi:hypothetical protein